jgi:uncharacterized glyoxalase superfamily protein PhnB
VPDPFEMLSSRLTPIAPDPSFARQLRHRLSRAINLPEGVTVSDIETVDLNDYTESSESPGSPAATITPYLAVSGAEAAIEWYVRALGARPVGQPIVMPDGRIGHAELDIAGAPLMLSEQHPEIGVVAPAPGEGVAVTLHLAVTDVDVIIDRTVSAGATLERPAADYDYGRNGVIRDPFGHRWMLSGPARATGLRHGDIGYVSLWVHDVAQAATFFSAVLGWRYGPGSGAQGRQVEGLTLHHGLWSGEIAGQPVAHATLFCCFAVDDVATTTERVRAAGGTAGAPHDEPYGLISDCVDDQGVPFAVFEPPGGVIVGDPSVPTGPTHGELAYLTVETVDSDRARAFYGSVLRWRFAPGRVDDGWQVEGVNPMVGISGGHAAATVVPMYRVDDIAGAVESVRHAGGSATSPEVQPYGITSTCADDQGTRFYLGQL